MQRITMTLDDALLDFVDSFMREQGYDNRSEAMRDLIREAQARRQYSAVGEETCVAAFSYVFDHNKRELSQKLQNVQHEHHALTISTLHVHLDHDSCLEVSVLKGRVDSVRELANTISSQRGVRYGSLTVLPARVSWDEHEHGGESEPHVHIRV